SKPVPSADAGEGDETTYYFLTDHLGSVDAVLDEDGNVVERRDYLPYGSQRAVETFNGVPITDLGFTGKELDSETGLNYYGARYYDPITGRFITMDPLLLNLDKMSQAQRNAFLSNPRNLNMYSYVQNNPVNYVDPTGEWGVAAGLGGKSHQYITSNAIENASLCLNAEDRDTLIYSASIWSDWLVYRFGEDKKNYDHSTSSVGSMTALEIKDAMMSDAKKWYTSGYLDEFGRLLHMVEDSYAPGHVERDSKGNITAFLDASKQTLSFHTKYDNYLDANDEVRPEALQAIGVATKLIDYYYNSESWDVVENYLDTEVLKGVNGETSVGSAGKKFYNEED
ncbi:MAG: RHS repeat-associated core domain-containing protein, partial [Patescibacteria group bacterium]